MANTKSNAIAASAQPTVAQQSMMRAAAAREDRCLAPLRTLRGAQIVKAGETFVAAGWAREVRAKPSQPVWRRDAESRAAFALKLTAAGAKAAGAAETTFPNDEARGENGKLRVRKGVATATPVAKVERSPAQLTAEAAVLGSPRPTSKLAVVIAMLRRSEGATLAELVAATGWLPHTTRAALTGLRKRGYFVTLDRSDRAGGSVYRIEVKPNDGVGESTEAAAVAV